MTESGTYASARKAAETKYGFYRHLAVYVVVISVLILINLLTFSGSYWVIWPILGWGVAIVFHALSAFFFSGSAKIIDRLTERELEKQNPSGR